MYLNQEVIKGLMKKLNWTIRDLEVHACISHITVWKIITKTKCNVSAETSMRIYIAFKIEGVVKHPSELIDVELMDRESIKILR